MSFLAKTASFLGYLSLIYAALRFLRWLLHCLRPGVNPAKWGAKQGAWAVVTGAAGGIGSGFAEDLAKKGFNLFLMDISEGPLNELKAKIASKYGVTISTLVCDFSQPREAWEPKVRDQLASMDVGMLVNNVGINTRYPDEHTVHTDQEVYGMLQVNINTTVAMTRLVLPTMVHKRRGGIVMLSSYTGSFPAPLMAIYSASKSFIDVYSQALYRECKPYNVDVISVRPFYVMSKMSGFRRQSFTVITPVRLAQDTFRYLGRVARAQPYWVHQALEFAMSLMPLNLVLRIHYNRMAFVRDHLKKKHALRQASAATQ